jgi:FdhD protein
MATASQDHDSLGARTRSVSLLHRDGSRALEHRDAVAIEEPLEIRLGNTPLAVTMRTPGDDVDLVYGFLLTEGIVLRPSEIERVEPVGPPGESRITAILAAGVQVDATQFQRRLFVSSSCGICGKSSIEAVRLFSRPVAPFTVTRAVVASLTTRLREQQPAFQATGGLHVAGVFDLEGRALAVREDVGRHNAVDKAIGAAARSGWPLPPALLVVSGRQSFEIVQKAAMAGIGGVVGVSAPSSLAVDLAIESGLLLVGFARGSAFNVYAGADRVSE